MLVLVVSSSCISIAQAIDDNTPGFGSSSSTGRRSEERFRKTRDRSADKAPYYGDERLLFEKGAVDSIAGASSIGGIDPAAAGEAKNEAHGQFSHFCISNVRSRNEDVNMKDVGELHVAGAGKDKAISGAPVGHKNRTSTDVERRRLTTAIRDSGSRDLSLKNTLSYRGAMIDPSAASGENNASNINRNSSLSTKVHSFLNCYSSSRINPFGISRINQTSIFEFNLDALHRNNISAASLAGLQFAVGYGASRKNSTKIKSILDFSMKATSTFPWNVSAWNISASVRSLRDGVQRSCEIVASELFGYSHLAINAVQEGGGATLPMLSTFILGLYIVQWFAAVKAPRRQDRRNRSRNLWSQPLSYCRPRPTRPSYCGHCRRVRPFQRYHRHYP